MLHRLCSINLLVLNDSKVFFSNQMVKAWMRLLWTKRGMLSEFLWCCWFTYRSRSIIGWSYKGSLSFWFAILAWKLFLGSFNLSKRRSKWTMDYSECIYIFQCNIGICTKNGSSLLSNILIVCFILRHLALRWIFKWVLSAFFRLSSPLLIWKPSIKLYLQLQSSGTKKAQIQNQIHSWLFSHTNHIGKNWHHRNAVPKQ